MTTIEKSFVHFLTQVHVLKPFYDCTAKEFVIYNANNVAFPCLQMARMSQIEKWVNFGIAVPIKIHKLVTYKAFNILTSVICTIWYANFSSSWYIYHVTILVSQNLGSIYYLSNKSGWLSSNKWSLSLANSFCKPVCWTLGYKAFNNLNACNYGPIVFFRQDHELFSFIFSK